MIKVVNDFSDKLSVSASLLYNRNLTQQDYGPGQLNNVTVFGTGAGAAGQQNPFFTAPAGAPNANMEIINWLATREDGKYGIHRVAAGRHLCQRRSRLRSSTTTGR